MARPVPRPRVPLLALARARARARGVLAVPARVLIVPFAVVPFTVVLAIAMAFALAAPAVGQGSPSGEASSSEDAADLVLRHGVFHPVEPPEPVEGSLAVRDGVIVALGPDAEVAPLVGPETEVIDLAGRAVTPGLIDAHSHLVGLGDALASVDLVGLESYAAVVERVAAAAAELPAGTWVQGRGWDQNRWADTGREFPHHRDLSAAVPDHPVWLTRVDGHAALLNRAALDALGVDAASEDPPGGRILRDADGAPTGVLIDNAMGVGAAIPETPAPERRRRLTRAAATAASLGLTTVTDMGVDATMIDDYRAVLEAGDLPVRAALFLTDRPALLDAWFERGPEIDPAGRLTVRGIKLYADGALGSRGAALVEPYSDDPGNLGLLTTTGLHVREVARRALDRGFQVGIHVIGDRGALVALDALEDAFGGEARPAARFRLEHAQVMRLADIERAASLGIVFSVQPTHATSDMPWAEERVGPRRIRGAYAWRRQVEAGGRLALGSDFPVESPDPRLGLYAAVTRRDLDGDPAGGWYPGQALSRQEALRGFTLDAARSLFLDHLVGSLEVGKRADLVVFGADPMTVPAAELATVPVELTVVDGRVVHRRQAGPEGGAP